MLELSMVGALNALVDLLIKAYRTIITSAVKETKLSILELCCLVNDTIIAAERLLKKVGRAKYIQEVTIDGFDWRYAMLELQMQYSRLHRIDSIIRENELVNLDTSLKNQFDDLIQWKEGILYGYGAAIYFFYTFGLSDITTSEEPGQKHFDILRFCFFNSEPHFDIDRDEIISNIDGLKNSLSKLENDVKQLLTTDEIIKLSKKAREQANKYSTTDPTLL